MPQTLRRGGHHPLPTGTRSGLCPSRASGIAAIAVALLALAAARAAAVTVTVPDDFKTIQQAIDSGADTVLVRDGDYAEVPQANRGVTLQGLGARRPRLAGLAISNPYSWLSLSWDVGGIDFTGPVTLTTSNWQARYLDISFDRCALSGGLQHDLSTATDPYDIYLLNVTHCHLGGGSMVSAARVSIVSDTIASGVFWRAEEAANVQSCWFTGGSGTALALQSHSEPSGLIEGNTIEGYQYGISVGGSNDLVIRNNVVRDMTEFGIGVDGSAGTISGNTVTGCKTGIVSLLLNIVCDDNVILRNRGTGVWCYAPTSVEAERNVVGRCGDSGLVILIASSGDFELANNTVFENAPSGILIPYGSYNQVTLRGNVFYANKEWGLQTGTPLKSLTLSCNDWFANGLGAVAGVAPGTTDLTVDPGFCDISQDDTHLSAGSPLLASSGCDTIGALGRGCDAPIIARLTTFTAASAADGIEVRWRVADAAPGFVAWIERAEAAAGPWANVESERTSDGDVTVEYDRTTAPARSYWYRLVATDRGLTRALGEPIQVEAAPPTRFALLGTGPNPSPGAVEATFQLAQPADITLELFDAQGRLVATLARGSWPAGIQHATRAGAQLASGIYLVRYRHPGGEDLRRIAIVR